MRNRKKYMQRLLILGGLLLSLIGQAQIRENGASEQINTLYKNGVTFFAENKLFEAISEFEGVIKLDPNHKDALYNLAIINDRLKDTSAAIDFLLRGLRLNDKRSAKLLVDKFNYKLTYADTMQNIDVSTHEKYKQLKNQQVLSLSDLTNKILSKTPNKKEQLQILLLWFSDNMKADSIRFFEGGNPLSNSEAFTKRIGLCDEYSNILSTFCKAANIPNYKVAGYVKYPSFNPGDKFTEANHAWNAVYLDSSWILCDLFWSTVALTAETTHFVKRIETNYFLGHPIEFINDHLPSDPVFQFSEHPISMGSFTKKVDGIDTTIPKMKYLNYTDSLNQLSKMNQNEQLLKIAQHSYQFNKDNPNDMIAESYNYAVDVINKNTSTKQELMMARKSLTKALSVIDTSKNQDIRSLKENCKHGITIIDKRISSK
jgi:tetratricopeptide (TPR) repeat protein